MDIDLRKYRYRAIRMWSLIDGKQCNHVIFGESVSKPNNKDCRLRLNGLLTLTIEDDEVMHKSYLFANKEALMRTLRKYHGRIRLKKI